MTTTMDQDADTAHRHRLEEVDYVDFREGRVPSTDDSIVSSTIPDINSPFPSLINQSDDRLSKRSILCVRVSFLNIILMGLGFMLNIGVYNTAGMAQTVVLSSVNTTYMQGSNTLGYNLFAVLCGSQAVAYLLGPAVVAVTGPKLGMVLGSMCVTFYLACFIQPLIVTLYISAAFAGFGVGIIWTVQGFFVTINSTSKRVLRNTGVFWILYTSSLVTGNLFYFFMMRGQAVITNEKRIVIFSIFTASSALGVVVFALVVHPWTEKIPRPQVDLLVSQKVPTSDTIALVSPSYRSPKEAFYATIKFTFRKDILILMPMFFYIGVEGSFLGSVYLTSLGYTTDFGDIKQEMVGLAGAFAGSGEIVGGIILGLLGRWMHFNGKDGALMCGMILHIIAAYLTFLNIPAVASLRPTTHDEHSYLGYSDPYLAMFTVFLFGLGDAIWNNQLMAYLGEVHRHECVSVFAVYQFWCALGASGTFLYATVLTIPWQLLILIIVGIPAAGGFCYVEWQSLRKHITM